MILAIDPSTKTGWCTYHNGAFNTGLITFPKLTGIDRVMAFHDWLCGKIVLLNPDLIVFENYGFANAHTLATLVEVGTAFRIAAHKWKVPFALVSPNGLKKFVIGKGVGKKEDVILATYKRWQFEAKTNDEVDAYVLARIGMALIGETLIADLPVYQQQVIEAIRKGEI